MDNPTTTRINPTPEGFAAIRRLLTGQLADSRDLTLRAETLQARFETQDAWVQGAGYTISHENGDALVLDALQALIDREYQRIHDIEEGLNPATAPKEPESDIEHIGSECCVCGSYTGLYRSAQTGQVWHEDCGCSECGEPLGDDEGYDSLCGNCADKAKPDDEDPTR